MEIHHPHLHTPKKFKEYLFEFFMIFLAVTLGFFSEGIRENLNNRADEKEYIESFVEDLQTDYLNLDATIKQQTEKINRLDSMIYLLNTPNPNEHGALLYYFARRATRNISFRSNDRTIIQLKNSGGFKFITNNNIADSIVSYEDEIAHYNLDKETDRQEGELLYSYISKIFNSIVFQQMYNNTTNQVSLPKDNPPLRTTDKELINEFTYYLHQRKATFCSELITLQNLRQQSKSLADYLKKEYKIKEKM